LEAILLVAISANALAVAKQRITLAWPTPGALDDWTPAADCSSKIPTGATTGHRSSSLSIPARTMDSITGTCSPARPCFGHWLEYNGEAADNASHRLHQFLDRHLN
jgi:hypothetical protein